IVVTELPYQVNKAKLIVDMAELVKEGKLEGISELRAKSDKDGMRVVIELKHDAIPRVVLNQLYKHTVMQSTFGVIMLALVPDSHTGQLVPKIMPLKEVLVHYVEHRHAVVIRRTQFELDKALEREHILEGLKIAVDTIDEGEFTIEDLIAEEDMVITISHSGYIKRTSVSTYRKQRRGGRGLSGAGLKDEDFIERLFIGSTHDYILCFTDDGRCFWLKV